MILTMITCDIVETIFAHSSSTISKLHQFGTDEMLENYEHASNVLKELEVELGFLDDADEYERKALCQVGELVKHIVKHKLYGMSIDDVIETSPLLPIQNKHYSKYKIAIDC